MKRIKKIVFVILSILLGLVLAFNIYNFISIKVMHKDLASINGYAMLEVVSGSMEPTIYKGDIIIINTKDKDYKENDIITFRGKEGEFVTHRIIEIDDKTMITKGDNNNSEDDPIKISSIVGKYVTKINGGGRILSSFKNPFTMVMIFIIGLLGCVLLSTDSDGKPILEQDEKEFQEFLKSKNETKKEVKEEKSEKPKKETKPVSKTNSKKTSTPKKKINTDSKDTKETSKVSSTKKTNKSKTEASSKKGSKTPVKKVETKKNTPAKKTVAKVEPNKTVKNSSTKKTNSKKEEVKKPATKKATTSKKSTTNKTKKTTTAKSSSK